MKVLRVGLGTFLVLAGLAIWHSVPAAAIDIVPYTPPPAQGAAPILVSSYGFDGTNVIYVQLFNKTDEVVDLSGWRLEYQAAQYDEYSVLAVLDGQLKPSSYVVAATQLFDGADYPYLLPDIAGAPAATSLRLLPPLQYKHEDIKLPVKSEVSYWRRNVSESTGNYISGFTSFVPTEGSTLYGGGLYTFPDEAEIQVSEIFANPRDCSPIDTALDCRDYVKLFNPTTLPIDLSAFRLRSGYLGQSATSSSAFLLEGILEPGHYLTVTASADGHPLTLTNTGGYVWLEDTYGIKLYDSTVQSYADASSSTRKGQAWAYDEQDGTWKWTNQPTPSDSPSVFPVAIILEASDQSEPAPCQPNQYRSLETNRCRLLPVPSVVSLAACPAGQYRNPATNRCRKIEVSSTLAPCGEGEERNPVTNRCRQIEHPEAALTPCKPGQERNPETNRCRNKSSVSDNAPFPVEPIGQEEASFAGWWLLASVGGAGAGYGIWEWRGELASGIRRIMRYLPFHR